MIRYQSNSVRYLLVENPVSAVWHALLPTWHCASVPCWDASSDGWCGFMSPSPVCCDVDTGLTADTSIHPLWPRVSGGCVSRVEFSAGIRQEYPVAPCVPPETEADPVQRLFCQLNLAFDGLLLMFRL